MEDLNEEVQESVISQNVRQYSIIFPDEKEISEEEEDIDEEKGEDMSLNSTEQIEYSQNVREYSIIFPDERETSEEEDIDEEKGEDMSLNSTVIKSVVAKYRKQRSEPSISGTHSKTLDKESIPQVLASKISACSEENSNKVHIDPNPSKPELTIIHNTSASSDFDLMVGSVNSSVSMCSDYVNLAFKFPIALFSEISQAVLKNQQELASSTKEQVTRDSDQECHSREFIDIQESIAVREEIQQKTIEVICLEDSNGTDMLNESVEVAVQETETSETQKSIVAKRINLENTSDLGSHVSEIRLQDSIVPMYTEDVDIIPTGTEEANKPAFENAENDKNGISRAAVSKIQISHTGSDKRAEVSEEGDIVQVEFCVSNDKSPLKTSNVVDNKLHKNSVSPGTCEQATISKEVEHGSANIFSVVDSIHFVTATFNKEVDVLLKNAVTGGNPKELSEIILEGKPAILTLDTEVAEFVETSSQREVEFVSADLLPKSKLLGDTVDNNKDIDGNNISISKSDFILTETISEAKMPLETEEKLSKIVDSNSEEEKKTETGQTTNSETGVATEYKDEESIEILPVKSDRDEMLIEKISGQGTKDSSKLVSKNATESETSLSREAIRAENEGSRDGSSDVPCTDGNVSTNESSNKTEIEGDGVQESRKGKYEEQEDLKKKTATPSESTDDIDAAPRRKRNISTSRLAKDVIPENFPVTKDETSKRTDQSDNESNESISPTKRSLRSKSQGPSAPLNERKMPTKSRRLSEASLTVTKSSESADFAARKRRAATPDSKIRERMTVTKSPPPKPTKPGNSQTESSNAPKKPNIRSNQSASEPKSAKKSSASTAGSSVSTRKTRR